MQNFNGLHETGLFIPYNDHAIQNVNREPLIIVLIYFASYTATDLYKNY